jgi:hypothetical protein
MNKLLAAEVPSSGDKRPSLCVLHTKNIYTVHCQHQIYTIQYQSRKFQKNVHEVRYFVCVFFPNKPTHAVVTIYKQNHPIKILSSIYL